MLPLPSLLRRLRPASAPSRPRRTPRRPGRPLHLEPLEDRRLLAAGVGDAFLSGLYYGLLNQGLDPVGLSYWGNKLQTGASAGQVAAGILGSAEYEAREVQALYQ